MNQQINMTTVKALSLWQPWASLVALSAKQYETRHWSTKYRGPLVIHAAQNITGLRQFRADVYKVYDIGHLVVHYPLVQYAVPLFRQHFGQAVPTNLPLGYAVGIVDLVDVLPVERVRNQISNWERAFGNYSDGRYAWKLDNLRVFPKPILMFGGQRLFTREIDASLIERSAA